MFYTCNLVYCCDTVATLPRTVQGGSCHPMVRDGHGGEPGWLEVLEPVIQGRQFQPEMTHVLPRA